MCVVNYIIGIVNINKKVLCNDNLYKLSKDWPEGYYLVLKINSVLPNYKPIIAIGYNYNAHSFLSSITTEDTRSTILVFPIFISVVNRFIMLPFALLFTLLSCLCYLGLLMRFTPTTNPYSMIWNWKINVSISAVGYVYVSLYISFYVASMAPQRTQYWLVVLKPIS